MRDIICRPATLLFGAVLAILSTPTACAAAPASPDEILAASPASDWAPLDPANTLYMDVSGGRVVILLAPRFAPKTIANIKALVAKRYFDDSAIVRSQDNYVVQWAQSDDREKAEANQKGYAEFESPLSESFVALPDLDTYALKTGFDGDFPAATDGTSEWLTHCYGMVGVGRDTAPDSGTGVELYAVTGQAPRHLDRNITLVGRVVQGMEHLSALPRGTGTLGFYERPEQRTKVLSIGFASDLPLAQQAHWEYLKTDSPTFKAYIEARRNRSKGWFIRPAGHIDVCNIPLPIRLH